MRGVHTWALLALPLLLGTQPSASWAGEALGGETQDGAATAGFEARAYVPSAQRRAGEVRLIRRGDRSVVEVLLYSKILSRVVGAIRVKERRNWPEGSPGHEDATRYIEAIEATQQLLWHRIPKGDRTADRRQKMWVDFMISSDAAVVQVGGFESLDEKRDIRLTSREIQHQFAVSRGYARRNMRLITADAFQVEGLDLERLLQRLPEWADEEEIPSASPPIDEAPSQSSLP